MRFGQQLFTPFRVPFLFAKLVLDQAAFGDLPSQLVVRCRELRRPLPDSLIEFSGNSFLFAEAAGIAIQLTERALSNEVITVGETTLEDVAWWLQDRLLERGLGSEFDMPSVYVTGPNGIVARLAGNCTRRCAGNHTYNASHGSRNALDQMNQIYR